MTVYICYFFLKIQLIMTGNGNNNGKYLTHICSQKCLIHNYYLCDCPVENKNKKMDEQEKQSVIEYINFYNAYFSIYILIKRNNFSYRLNDISNSFEVTSSVSKTKRFSKGLPQLKSLNINSLSPSISSLPESPSSYFSSSKRYASSIHSDYQNSPTSASNPFFL